ncbi:MAG: ABC-F family ATP-binding cassette domain-containing protein [Bacteroidales bacterium]|nr:ABC-F family ATP-binding cassette domain-containing protein [Bacteroidales bacterium]
MNYLSAENLSKSFGEQILCENLTFGLERGDKTALIARNGTGKTTLLRILMGKMSSDTGEYTMRGGIKTAFLEQSPDLDDSLTIDQLILTKNTPVLDVIQLYERALDKHSLTQTKDTAKILEEATNEMDRVDAWDYERRLKQLLDLFRITDTTQGVSSLSGGEKKRLALALVILDEPDLLILDEPTNHLDIEMIEWLENYLSQTSLTLLMVTHDRYFLDRVCNHIIELSNGLMFHYQGNYKLFLEKRAERALLQKVESDKASQLMKKELEWLRRAPKARTGKSKARIDAFDGIEERATRVYDSSELRLQVKIPRLGTKILELDTINKSYGQLKIIENLSYKFSKGERLGVIGRNGTGKTSFLNVISGIESQDTGTIDRGATVVPGYYRQSGYYSQDSGTGWKETQRVIDAVKDIAEVVMMEDGKSISASQFLEHFLFTPEAQYKPISKLSGGELRRLHLLTVLIKNPNFLILDEPTNDLDLLALNKLEEFLLSYKGCLVIVSHDRYFLDKLTDHLFVFEGEGRIIDYYGAYSSYRHARDKGAPNDNSKLSEKKSKPGRQRTEIKVKTKLTFRETQEYNTLEPEIEDLEKEKALLEAELTEGKFDYKSLEQKSKRVAEIIDLIEVKLQRWLELGQYTG